MCKVPGCNAAAGHCRSLPGLAGEAINRLTANPVESMCMRTQDQIVFAFVTSVQVQKQHLLMGTNSIDAIAKSHAVSLHRRKRLPEGSMVERW